MTDSPITLTGTVLVGTRGAVVAVDGGAVVAGATLAGVGSVPGGVVVTEADVVAVAGEAVPTVGRDLETGAVRESSVVDGPVRATATTAATTRADAAAKPLATRRGDRHAATKRSGSAGASCPVRKGRSTKRNDTSVSAAMSATQTTRVGHPSSERPPSGSRSTITGQCQRYSE